MLASLIRSFCRDRKAATAVAMAIMTVPLLIGASAAVDFSRIASARTLLQASVDAAAIAGAGEWQMSESSSSAYTVTQNMYATTGAQLPSFVGTTPAVIQLACTGTTGAGAQTTNQCGGTQAFSTTPVTGCPTNASGVATFEYCVVVTETATLKNS
ncbi:MAG: pilus assembly protein TadG-related protein, partial [Acidocella sp.]|nr:pilus assembly protein TadG-related protein [Acidocella sp.]